MLLAAELGLLYLLLRSRKKKETKATLAALIYQAKRDFRQIARTRLSAETGIKVPKNIKGTSQADMKRSSKIASRLTQFDKERFAGISPTDKSKEAKTLSKEAEKAVQNRLRQVAAYEGLVAFEDERRLAVNEIARQTDAGVLKKWDATMDLKTCEECADNNGLEIPLKEEFPSGEPPLHPNCRCSIEYRFDT